MVPELGLGLAQEDLHSAAETWPQSSEHGPPRLRHTLHSLALVTARQTGNLLIPGGPTLLISSLAAPSTDWLSVTSVKTLDSATHQRSTSAP